ncbi:MAG: chemotaxis protein CheW [Bdellovibrionota bacterium]
MLSLATRNQPVQQKKFQKFVLFGLGRERYAVPVSAVKEIIRAERIFPLPKTPPFIEGIISLRGDIVPVVDLRKRFDLPGGEKTAESRIVVFEMESFYVGISVDQVFEVVKVEEGAIEAPPPLVAGFQADFLQGVCELNGHLVTVLDAGRIFSASEQGALAGVTGASDAGPSPGLAA